MSTAVTSPESGPRIRARLEESLLPPAVAILAAVVVGDLLILSFGQSPAHVYALLLEGTWGNAYGFGQVIFKATTLTFTGLAVAFALRAGMFNIGAEGQLAGGGFAAAMMGLLLPAGSPALLAIPLCILAAAAGGGVVGAVPGVLRARFGSHEVIVTIMLNVIVLALVNYLVASHLAVEGTLHTRELNAGVISRLGGAFTGSAANWSLLLGLVALGLICYGVFMFVRARSEVIQGNL